MNRLASEQLDAELSGSGVVSAQAPAAGTQVKTGSRIAVRCGGEGGAPEVGHLTQQHTLFPWLTAKRPIVRIQNEQGQTLACEALCWSRNEGQAYVMRFGRKDGFALHRRANDIYEIICDGILGNVSDGTTPQQLMNAFVILKTGEHYDLEIWIFLTDALGRLHPIHHRHDNIHED